MINPQHKRRIIDAVLRDIEGDRAVIEKIITLKNRLEDVLDNADGLIDLSISNMALLPYIAEIRQEQAIELENTISMLLDGGWQSPLIRRIPDQEVNNDG